MEQYKTLWKWMTIPMVVIQAGIFVDYWGDFTRNTLAVHIHYWNATLWFAFLISQPWLFARGSMAAHRTWGMFGLLLAGAMVFLSVAQLNRDIFYANFARDNAGEIGPFTEWFFFQVMMMEMILITGFVIAIVMAIVKRKSIEDHAWWMASTAFLLMMPALGRGLQGVWFAIHGFSVDLTSVLTIPVYICQAIIIGLCLLFAWRLGKLRHPATWIAVGANAALFIMQPIAQSPSVQALWRALIPV